MITDTQKQQIKQVLTTFDRLNEVDVSLKEGPDCVVSFTTTFGDNSAYDLELTEADGGYDIVLYTSSETPLMSDRIDDVTEDQVDNLFDHLIEILRELEGN